MTGVGAFAKKQKKQKNWKYFRILTLKIFLFHCNKTDKQFEISNIGYSELFLPTANEVCEGYVFTGVCLSTGGGGGSASRGGVCIGGGGICIQGWGWETPPSDITGYGQRGAVRILTFIINHLQELTVGPAYSEQRYLSSRSARWK